MDYRLSSCDLGQLTKVALPDRVDLQAELASGGQSASPSEPSVNVGHAKYVQI